MRQVYDKIKYLVGSREILEGMERIKVLPLFSDQALDFLECLSKRLMSSNEAKKYPDVIAYAFWIRRASLEKARSTYQTENQRVGKGTAFQIAPSNIPIQFAISLTYALIAGNGSIVRISDKRFQQVDIICGGIRSVLKDTYPEMASYICVIRYEHNDEITQALTDICDIRMIWGGNRTIAAIRKAAIKARCLDLGFADRYSIAVIDSGDYLKKDAVHTASDFYNDTYLTDQNACTSPRMVCWLGNKKEAEKAKEVFWDLLWNLVEKKYDFQPVQSMDKLTEGCMAVMHMDGIHRIKMRDNRIVRMELEKIDVRVQEYRGHSGFFYEYTTKDVTELAPLCNAKLQTIAFMGRKEQLMPLIKAGIRGIDRIVTIGRTMDFEMVWDGMDLEERMTRKITCTVE